MLVIHPDISLYDFPSSHAATYQENEGGEDHGGKFQAARLQVVDQRLSVAPGSHIFPVKAAAMHGVIFQVMSDLFRLHACKIRDRDPAGFAVIALFSRFSVIQDFMAGLFDFNKRLVHKIGI